VIPLFYSFLKAFFSSHYSGKTGKMQKERLGDGEKGKNAKRAAG